MSKETLEWLNENTLIGFTDKRGKAWHYREGAGNHYTDAVPVEDVHTRLFSWTAEERPLYVPGGPDEDMVRVPDRKAVVRSDNAHVMGIFKSGYQPHQYGEWLVHNVGSILDADLRIGSAGLLKGGAVAWVSVEVPDTIVTPEGVAFRPNLLAATSFDGSVATTYKRVITNVVCDNTMSVALNEGGGQVHKIRHSKNSMGKLENAREALGIIHGAAEEFEAEVQRLTRKEVTPRTWDRILDAIAPLPEHNGEARTRALTMAENKRDQLTQLWNHDPRVAPWSGTAFGVWQAVNTYQHHVAIVRGAGRAERNMMAAVDGSYQEKDNAAMTRVLAVL